MVFIHSQKSGLSTRHSGTLSLSHRYFSCLRLYPEWMSILAISRWPTQRAAWKALRFLNSVFWHSMPFIVRSGLYLSSSSTTRWYPILVAISKGLTLVVSGNKKDNILRQTKLFFKLCRNYITDGDQCGSKCVLNKYLDEDIEHKHVVIFHFHTN